MNYKAIFEANRDNTDMLAYLAQEVNSYDGSLDNLEIYEFDEDFFNTYFENNPMEAVRAAHFGEIESWSDEYIRFNGLGNLESLSSYKRDEELRDSADDIIEYALELIEDGSIDVDWYIENSNLTAEETN